VLIGNGMIQQREVVSNVKKTSLLTWGELSVHLILSILVLVAFPKTEMTLFLSQMTSRKNVLNLMNTNGLGTSPPLVSVSIVR
jgi:hypothetical protein